MMVRKYGIEKIDDMSLDFFRDAMSMIVRKDNDELFNKFLSQKSGRASNMQHADQTTGAESANAAGKSLKKFLSSV